MWPAGLGIQEAKPPCLRATSPDIQRRKTRRSAALSASVNLKSVSNCPAKGASKTPRRSQRAGEDGQDEGQAAAEDGGGDEGGRDAGGRGAAHYRQHHPCRHWRDKAGPGGLVGGSCVADRRRPRGQRSRHPSPVRSSSPRAPQASACCPAPAPRRRQACRGKGARGRGVRSGRRHRRRPSARRTRPPCRSRLGSPSQPPCRALALPFTQRSAAVRSSRSRPAAKATEAAVGKEGPWAGWKKARVPRMCREHASKSPPPSMRERLEANHAQSSFHGSTMQEEGSGMEHTSGSDMSCGCRRGTPRSARGAGVRRGFPRHMVRRVA